MTRKASPGQRHGGTEVQRTGVWRRCISCEQHLPCDPDTEMCGACTFGEAAELMAFDGTYTVIVFPPARGRHG